MSGAWLSSPETKSTCQAVQRWLFGARRTISAGYLLPQSYLHRLSRRIRAKLVMLPSGALLAGTSYQARCRCGWAFCILAVSASQQRSQARALQPGKPMGCHVGLLLPDRLGHPKNSGIPRTKRSEHADC